MSTREPHDTVEKENMFVQIIYLLVTLPWVLEPANERKFKRNSTFLKAVCAGFWYVASETRHRLPVIMSESFIRVSLHQQFGKSTPS